MADIEDNANFGWVPFYTELAEKLIGYKNRQGELIQFLEGCKQEGLPVGNFTDQDQYGESFLIREIDPFTFFGTFNRKLKRENRLGIMEKIKTFFGIDAPVANAFSGIPRLNNQRAWFIPYASKRLPDDVETLWKIFEIALDQNPLSHPEFDPTFDKALAISGTSYNLTMGLYWIRPDEFINMDSVNRLYLNYDPKPLNAINYRKFLDKAKEHNKPFYLIFHEAHLSRSDSVQLTPNHFVKEQSIPKQETSVNDLTEETGISQENIQYWLNQLHRKKQVIFQGPPGTGKTFIAEKLAKHLVSDEGLFQQVQFHPSYSYEEFIQGIRPDVQAGQMSFSIKDGIFKQFCHKAQSIKGPCVFLIDEINRGNLSNVFGELMYLLEYRNKTIQLPHGDSFSIPDNVYIIGTMNTADRSIALMDHALRRRFAFLFLSPDTEVLSYHLENSAINIDGLIDVLIEIQDAVGDKHYELGHSFFLGKPSTIAQDIEAIWTCEIEPYLEEYFFDQPQKIESFRWEKVSPLILPKNQITPTESIDTRELVTQ